MRKGKFAICDNETMYACSLMEYMTERKKVPFDVQVFSELESLMDSLEEEELEMLLIASDMMCPKVEELNIGKIMILSEGEVEREYLRFPMIYKYQPSEQLVSEILSCIAKDTSSRTVAQGRKTGKILGIYAPIGRCGKTCFALVLGQILAEKAPVLYLNLEEYSGFEELLDQEFATDLLDVCYLIRQKKENAMLKLNAALQKIGKLDYVPSVHSAEDLKEVTSEEWLELLTEIVSCGGYETVVLDVGSPVEEPYVLLSQCDRIYTPMVPGVMAKAKMAHYEKQLREMELEELLEKTRYVNLPFAEPKGMGEYYLEQMVDSELGEFVRMLLQEEATS